MITRFRQLFTLGHSYSSPLDRQRAQILLWCSAIMAVLLLWLALGALPQVRQGSANALAVGAAVVVLGASLVIYRLVQVGRLTAASWLFVAVLMLCATILTVLSNLTGGIVILGTGMVVLTIPLVATAVLLDRRALLVVTSILMAIVVLGALGQSQFRTSLTLQPAQRAPLDLLILILSLTVVSWFLTMIAGSFPTLVARSSDLMQQRSWVSGFGLELTNAADERSLRATALQGLRQNLPQLLTEWYVLNEDGSLSRSARQVESARHTIRATNNNILAEAAQSGQILTASLSDEPSRRTHIAASTAFAAAVPIRVGEVVAGILDFQSSLPFSGDQLDIFQLVAQQVGHALGQVRQVQALQTSLHEYETTITRLQAQVQAGDQRRRQGIGDMWNSFIEGRGSPIIGYSLNESNAAPVPISELPATLAASLSSGEVQIEKRGDEQLIHVPITFRDYHLGAMSFAVPADQPITERQVEVARTVAERLALALENTRLFEQSQAQAQRERKANEIASVLIGATDVRLVLNLAAENFKDALGAVNTHIYIQPDLLADTQARTPTEAAP